MKHRIAFLVFLALIATGLAGCATSARRSSSIPRPRSFALAITVNGSLQPTPQQWAMLQATFAKYLAQRGWVLVSDLSLADHILRVDFTPNPDDPEERGHARVLGIRANPTTVVASRGTSPLRGQFGYAYGMGSGWPYSTFYSSSYYGYGDLYYDGFSNGWGLVTTPVVTTPTPPAHPPYRHPPDNREYCPPEHVRPAPGFVADNGSVGSNPVYHHPRPPPSDSRPAGSDRSHASRSDRSYSYNNDAAAYRARESYSSSSSSYSSSEPSYYSPSTSSSESSASSSSSVAAAASMSSAAASAPISVMTK